MNRLLTWLRKLWPFVTRWEHRELKTWVRKLESKHAAQMQLHDNAAEVRRKVDDEITELKIQLDNLREVTLAVYNATINENGGDVWQVSYVTPKKKPSRKKPAKKGKKK